MALVALPTPTPYPDARAWGATGRLTQQATLLDAAGEKVGWVINMPVAGTISRIGILIGTVTTAQSLDIRVETVDPANGRPTGTLWAANTSGALAAPATDTWYWVTLTAGATVAVGDIIAIVVQWTSTVGSLSVLPAYVGGTLSYASGLPYLVAFTTGAWVKTTNPVNVAVEMSDGSRPYVSTMPAIAWVLFTLWGAGNDYNQKGTKFTLPFPCKITGAIARVSTANGSFDLILYDSGSVELAHLYLIDSEWVAQIGAAAECATPFFFPSEITLNANEMYRLVLSPTVAGPAINCEEITVDSRETLQAWPGGFSFQKTERRDDSGTGAGPFGEWDIADFSTLPRDQNRCKRMFIYPIISAVDDGTGTTMTPRILSRREFRHESDPLFEGV